MNQIHFRVWRGPWGELRSLLKKGWFKETYNSSLGGSRACDQIK